MTPQEIKEKQANTIFRIVQTLLELCYECKMDMPEINVNIKVNDKKNHCNETYKLTFERIK